MTDEQKKKKIRISLQALRLDRQDVDYRSLLLVYPICVVPLLFFYIFGNPVSVIG
jgi:hypothetical protein